MEHVYDNTFNFTKVFLQLQLQIKQKVKHHGAHQKNERKILNTSLSLLRIALCSDNVTAQST